MALVIGGLGTRPIRKLLNGSSVPFFAKALLTEYSHRMAVVVRRSNAFPDSKPLPRKFGIADRPRWRDSTEPAGCAGHDGS
jgi:hypothetical protein